MSNTQHYSKKQFSKNLNNLNSILKETSNQNNKYGGSKKDESNIRTFKVVELNGKVVDFGNFTIKKKTSGGNPGPGPLTAARKPLEWLHCCWPHSIFSSTRKNR